MQLSWKLLKVQEYERCHCAYFLCSFYSYKIHCCVRNNRKKFHLFYLNLFLLSYTVDDNTGLFKKLLIAYHCFHYHILVFMFVLPFFPIFMCTLLSLKSVGFIYHLASDIWNLHFWKVKVAWYLKSTLLRGHDLSKL